MISIPCKKALLHYPIGQKKYFKYMYSSQVQSNYRIHVGSSESSEDLKSSSLIFFQDCNFFSENI